jgi:hypothetical protein
VEPGREELEDLMRRNGLEEKEAEAAYHLKRASEIFDELHRYEGDPGIGLVRDLQNQMAFGIHFGALTQLLALRVAQRDHPEGWRRRRESEENPPDTGT